MLPRMQSDPEATGSHLKESHWCLGQEWKYLGQGRAHRTNKGPWGSGGMSPLSTTAGSYPWTKGVVVLSIYLRKNCLGYSWPIDQSQSMKKSFTNKSSRFDQMMFNIPSRLDVYDSLRRMCLASVIYRFFQEKISFSPPDFILCHSYSIPCILRVFSISTN